MSDQAFITLVNMSLTAGYAILALLLLRAVFRRTPKRLLYGLWALPLFRLVCPVSIESVLSLLPSAQPIPPDITYQAVPAIHSGISALNSAINPALAQSAPQAGASVNPLQVWCFAGKIVWLLGLTAFLCYGIVSYARLGHGFRFAVKDGEAWRSPGLASPMVLGLFRPRIYLPQEAEGEAYILAHERAHIARGDHIIKPFAFLVLCVHWFNPLAWLAYWLMARDMEGACDERVLKGSTPAQRKEYAACLLSMGVRHSGLAVPLAFGESDTAGRIKRVLNYKKPAFWLILAALAAAAILCATLLSNPPGSVPLLNADEMVGRIVAGQEELVLVATTQEGRQLSNSQPQAIEEALAFISALRVREEPVNRSRDEGRDRTNILGLFRPSGSNLYSTDFNFSADYTYVWVDNGVKPGFTFELADPSKARAFFEGFKAGNAATSPVPEEKSMTGPGIRIGKGGDITGSDLRMLAHRRIADANPTYYIGNTDVADNLAQLPVYPYMVISSNYVLQVLVEAGVEAKDIRLSHTLLGKDGRPLYHKEGGATPLDEECELVLVGHGVERYTYTLTPSYLVALSSKMEPFPEGALRAFSLRYRIGEQWNECCFVLRTDEGMHPPASATPDTAAQGAPEQVLAAFLETYFEQLSTGGTGMPWWRSEYRPRAPVQTRSEDDRKAMLLLYQWAEYKAMLAAYTGLAPQEGSFVSLDTSPQAVHSDMSVLEGYVKTMGMRISVKARLYLAAENDWVISWVEFPDWKEYNAFCRDFSTYMGDWDYSKNMYIEKERKALIAQGYGPAISPARAQARYTLMQETWQPLPSFFQQPAAGDWDGDGKSDQAGFAGEGRSLTVRFGDGSKIEANAQAFSSAAEWGREFSIAGADVNGDGAKELLLCIDLGGQGGDGSYTLLVYARDKAGWLPLQSPQTGPEYLVYWDGEHDAVRLACEATGYVERMVDQTLIRPYLDWEQDAARIQERIAHMESLGKQSSVSASDPISAFQITQDGHILTRQYVTAPGGSHAEHFGYMVTEYVYYTPMDALAVLSVLSAWFVPVPVE